MLAKYTGGQLSRALAMLFVVVLLANWRLIAGWFWVLPRAPFSDLSLITAGYVGLMLGSIFGLLCDRAWAFYCIYVMIPLTTVLLAISFVPILPGLLPFPLNTIALTILNVLVLVVAAIAHARYSRE